MRLFVAPFPTISSDREVRRFVAIVVLISVVASVSIEGTIEWFARSDFQTVLRGFTISGTEAGLISCFVAYFIARAYRAVYEAKQAAERASLTDPLTGLLNRRALNARAETLTGATLALVIADIDHFKRVNDTYGHLAGDKVIAAVARHLSEALAEFGPLARVGGEEFALLTGVGTSQSIAARVEEARRGIAETPIAFEGEPLRVTISAGVATAGAGYTFDTLYSQADRALYLAKTSGRNRVLRFEDTAALEFQKVCA